MDHKTASRLLTELAGNRLSRENAAAVAAHTGECPLCAALVGLAREVRAEALTAGPGMFLAHPDPDTLVEMALGRAAVTDASLRDHVDSCPTCSREVALTRQANREARAPWWEPFGRMWTRPGGAQWRAAASAMAVVAVVLAYPAYQGLVAVPALRQSQERLLAERDQERERGNNLAREVEQARRDTQSQGSAWSGGVGVLVLAGSTRGAEAELPRVIIRPGQPVQPILAGFDLARHGGLQRTIVLSIRRVARQREVWTHRCTAREVWDAPNQLTSILVPTAALDPGAYELTITEAAGGTPVYRAPFLVEAVGRERP